MLNSHRFRQSMQVKRSRSPLADLVHRFIVYGITTNIVLMTINGFAPNPGVAAQEANPGAVDPIVPAARRFLFPKQQAG